MNAAIAKELLTGKYANEFRAYAEGKQVEHLTLKGWQPVEYWNFYDFPNSQVRIKPEAKLRPWKPEEVPVGALMRRDCYSKGEDLRVYMIISCTPNFSSGLHCCGILLSAPCAHGPMSPESFIKNDWKHSTDGGKTWLPCGII